MDATDQADTEAPTETAENAPSEAAAETAASDETAQPEPATAQEQAATMDTESMGSEPQTAATSQPADEQPAAQADEQPAAQAAEQPAAQPDQQVVAQDDGQSDATPDALAEMATAAADMAAEGGPAAPAEPDELATADLAAQPTGGNGAAPAEAALAVEAPAADETADAPAADATEAPAADATAEATGATKATRQPVETAEAPTPPPAPAPRVYDGPEPTTMEELLNEQATEIRSLKHGDVVEGNVVRIDKDEILVDIGAKSEGVISNRELYGRNAESQPQLNIGDQVLVYVLQPESPEGHAVLSLRRAGLERKWRAMQEQLDAGVIIEAPVIDHNKGGLIVDCGIRGFVPISQIVDFPRRPQNEQPRDAAQEIAEKLQPYVGRKLRLKILEVNRKANRLILSEKVALYEERREKRDELFSSLQVGQKVTGTVRSIAPFGVFVDLGGIDGLVHKSELSWNKVNNPEAGYRVGEEVEAEVIDINHERGRISLSIRRLQPDPWHSTVADLKVGDLIDGTVTKIVNFGAFVRVRDGLEGLIHISELSHARVAHPGDVVHEGQTLKLKIISLDQERHRLGLSLKQAEEAPARPEPAASGTGSAPRERRPRGGDRDRGGYDMSQAVQEPEGGIDNTLAAAFAQVRQQIEQTEAARSASGATDVVAEADAETPAAEAETPAAEAETTAAESAATAESTPEAAVTAESAPEAPADVTAEAMAEMPSAETTAAEGAAEVDSAADADSEAAAKPARKSRATKGKAEPAADVDTSPSADEPAAEAAPPDEPEPAPKPEAKARKTKASAQTSDEAAPDAATQSAAAGSAAEHAAEPAEVSPDAASTEGADTEETAS